MAVKGGIKFLRKRVRAIQNLKKVTKAMKSVSSVRLKRSQVVLQNSLEFFKNMEQIMRVTERVDPEELKLHDKSFTITNEGKKNLYIILGSDKGLCGSFNSNLVRFVQDKIRDDGEIWVFGRRLVRALSKKLRIIPYEDFQRGFSYERFEAIYKEIEAKIVSGEISEVYCIYNFFKSMGTQYPTMEKLFPIAVYIPWEPKRIIEPSFDEFARFFIMAYFKSKLFFCFQSSLTSEHAARMRAMDMATQNAERVLKILVLQMNKARQESITKELIDIVGGKNALEARQI